jgi:hypothetical protein
VAAAGLVKTYATSSRQVTALRGVDLQVAAESTVTHYQVVDQVEAPSGSGEET